MTHDERVWHHEMVTNEGIHEHAERIASLEEALLRLSEIANYICDHWDNCEYCDFGSDDRRGKCELGKVNDRMAELVVTE